MLVNGLPNSHSHLSSLTLPTPAFVPFRRPLLAPNPQLAIRLSRVSNLVNRLSPLAQPSQHLSSSPIIHATPSRRPSLALPPSLTHSLGPALSLAYATYYIQHRSIKGKPPEIDQLKEVIVCDANQRVAALNLGGSKHADAETKTKREASRNTRKREETCPRQTSQLPRSRLPTPWRLASNRSTNHDRDRDHDHPPKRASAPPRRASAQVTKTAK
ncbi:hypothetical protein AB1N83_013325 [Pleurotus pulmonarius]